MCFAAKKPESVITETDGIVEGTGANVRSFNKNTGEFVLKKATDFSIFDFSDEIEPGTFLPWSRYVKDIKTAVIRETVDYIKKNPIKIQIYNGSFKAKQLKTKNRSDVVFYADNCYSDKVKVSVVKSKTSKALRNKVKSVNVFYGKLTLKKGSYKKGDFKLVFEFFASAYLGHKSAVVTKTFNIKIK